MFQATKAIKDDTRKLVGTVNRVLGGPLVEEKLDTLFAGMWPELEKKLGGIPTAGRAAAPARPEREMVAEVLELVRAGTVSSAKHTEALTVLTKALSEVLQRVSEPRAPLSAFGAPSTFGGIGGIGSTFGRGTLAEMIGVVATEETPESKAKRARLVAEIRKELEQEGKEGNDESK